MIAGLFCDFMWGDLGAGSCFACHAMLPRSAFLTSFSFLVKENGLYKIYMLV